MRISWHNTPGPESPMQDAPDGDLPSLSATCPTTNNIPPEKAALKDYHHNTEPSTQLSDNRVRPGKKAFPSKVNEAALRDAKKEIAGKVREDWTWPYDNLEPDALSLDINDTAEWRERESDSEYSPPSPVLNADPYRYENPESVAQPVLTKKRKRRLLLDHEIQWNTGLKMYTERRDAWTGAKNQRPLPPEPESPSAQPSFASHESSQLPTSPSLSYSLPLQSISPSTLPTTLVPLAPPILPPENPIRASIQPATYPAIYDKIIIRGLSPTVPINLKDVVHALVAGWKKDDEWPPKSEPEKAAAAEGPRGEGNRLARRSVGRVKRVLGLGRGIDGVAQGEGSREE